jgi:CheY-like chemotaxis protein
VKRVGKLIDSPITMTSVPGNGTTFSVLVSKGVPKQIKNEDDSKSEQSPINAAIVLVIDDEQAILNAMGALLEGWGYQAVLASDLEQAKSKLKEIDAPPNCIVADYRLRENHTGVEAIEALRESFKHKIPAIVVSGDIAKDKIRRVNEKGLQMLHKPVPPASLRSFLYNKIKLIQRRQINV